MSDLFKFKAYARAAEIVRVQIEKETEQCVWVRSWGGAGEARRTNKRSDYENYFDSWAEAHAFLMERAQAQVNAARDALKRANDHLGNVKGMKPPVEEDEGAILSKLSRGDE